MKSFYLQESIITDCHWNPGLTEPGGTKSWLFQIPKIPFELSKIWGICKWLFITQQQESRVGRIKPTHKRISLPGAESTELLSDPKQDSDLYKAQEVKVQGGTVACPRGHRESVAMPDAQASSLSVAQRCPGSEPSWWQRTACSPWFQSTGPLAHHIGPGNAGPSATWGLKWVGPSSPIPITVKSQTAFCNLIHLG